MKRCSTPGDGPEPNRGCGCVAVSIVAVLWGVVIWSMFTGKMPSIKFKLPEPTENQRP